MRYLQILIVLELYFMAIAACSQSQKTTENLKSKSGVHSKVMVYSKKAESYWRKEKMKMPDLCTSDYHNQNGR